MLPGNFCLQIYFLNFVFIMNRIYLEQESIKRRGIEMDWNRWQFEYKKHFPQQGNVRDCGVFILLVRINDTVICNAKVI